MQLNKTQVKNIISNHISFLILIDFKTVKEQRHNDSFNRFVEL